MNQQMLRGYFQFDESDLEANRAGRFTEKQIQRLEEARKEFGRDMRRTAFPFVLAALVGIFAAIFGRSMGWVWILIWGFGWTLLWGLLGWGFIEGSFTKRKYTMLKVKGRVKVGLKEGLFNFKLRKLILWSDLVVGNKRFEVKTDLNQLLNRGDEYIVYYEKGSNEILSLEFVSAAERLSPDAERLDNIDLEAEAKKLRKHFAFTEADLMSNQNGMLSEKQIQRNKKEERGGRGLGIFFGAFLLLFAALFLPMLVNAIKTMYQFLDILWVNILFISVLSVVGLIFVGIGGAGIFLIVSQFIGSSNYELKSVRGHANLIRGYVDRSSHVYYDLNVGGVQFDGDSGMPKAIIQDAEYIVYYLDKIYRVMSVELVSVD